MDWDESKHPRDDDGKFTDGSTPAEYKRLQELGIEDKQPANTLQELRNEEIKSNKQAKGIKAKTYYEIIATEKELKKIKEQIENEDKEKRKKLGNQVDQVLNGTYSGSHIVLCEKTPNVLKNLGVPDKPLLMTAKHTYLCINKSGKYDGKDDHYHNLGKELFMEIPTLLENPILVFQNKDNRGNLVKNNIVAVVNALDNNNNQIIVPIKIDGYVNSNKVTISANIAKSVYGRKNYQDFINKNVYEDNVLYTKNKKIREIR